MADQSIRLTQYSHGAGCGCKISPAVLEVILKETGLPGNQFPDLLVGNAEKDDAAVMDLGDGTCVISTTDFFMPIVDDAFIFGQIAATNAISDIYAMGGTPMMAIAILGWPINMLPAELAGQVILGGQRACSMAGIPLAGGHSIDAPEPIFGLAVTGRMQVEHLKRNGGARPGDILFLTKSLGVGIFSTAQKHGKLTPEHAAMAVEVMIQLNTVGERLGKIKGVSAMTDVTGFGLGGHLIEMCKASGTTAQLDYASLPIIDQTVFEYIQKGCIPGGTGRNIESYGHEILWKSESQKPLMCDPQTSGGLLLAVDPTAVEEVSELLRAAHLNFQPVGHMTAPGAHAIVMA